ncbi:alpha-1,2-fucosyltransferase [Flavobacterium sp.]|uniref:alpha-1,2-fucosyltransferase n=1 Tax=Flavobacterium sp. TaxID=239 RepID=UPI002626891B|nr:alpha-1,2-fucosyltransferase [Flavobacterium sp.]MDG2432910.1 alpha-1,2-fucosyltransferase [Flavobacterium sp.]
MIKVDLWGRMGNQMFQYAFAIATARKLQTKFIIAPTQKFELTKYFVLDPLTNFLYSSFFCKLYARVAHRMCAYETIFQIKEKEVMLKDQVRYRGFFQSENFFQTSVDEVKKRLVIKKRLRAQFQEKYGKLFSDNKTIVMHFRRTDYISHGDESYGGQDMSLPMKYYDNCLQLINDVCDYQIICISDDIVFVKEYYKYKSNYLFLENDAIIDFQLILNADIAIIANSSFSWWAAYLNEKVNKVIYAPKFWLGFKIKDEIPADVIPNDFQAVNVN